MTWQAALAAELTLRAALTGDEVTAWQAQADADQDGFGIHRGQIRAMKVMFDELAQAQARMLAGLDAGAAPAEFARARLEIEQQLTAVHGIVAIFRIILAQREDPQFYRAALDLADFVAADCYQPCITRATSWGAIAAERCRVPPLTYLNTLLSPAAFTRRHAFGAFRMPLDGYLDLKLPISVLSLPFHHTRAVWTFCSLHHEVGHVIDQDLGLRASLAPLLEAALPAERKTVWTGWLRELIADAFGVLLGQAGYGSFLPTLLFLPESLVTTIDPSDPHPTPYVRIHLIARLLERSRLPALATLAGEMTTAWHQAYQEPAALAPFVGDCDAVANVLLDTKVPALQDHALCELVTEQEMGPEHAMAAALASYLRLGTLKPETDDPQMRARLVPVAAQMAMAAVTANHAQAGADIQRRAFEYMAALRDDLPQFLAADAGAADARTVAARETYYRDLVRQLDFSRLEPFD